MRGSPGAATIGDIAHGIIPAGAGLTRCVLATSAFYRDHPRGCGAHMLSTSKLSRELGSSPRVRGSRSSASSMGTCAGIIPAGAGLTNFNVSMPSNARDHPRGCGAHRKSRALKSAREGSSPRVRGSPKPEQAYLIWAGIIPAGAGLTYEGNLYAFNGGDHPRGCGAHAHQRQVWVHAPGSSPRVRGSLSSSASACESQGIIPAGAGLTLISCSASSGMRDHPRGCGAHSKRRLTS